MKLLFLMLDSKRGPWEKLYENGAEKTWARMISPEDRFIRYRGMRNSFFEVHNSIGRIGNNKYNQVIWPLMERRNLYLRDILETKYDGKVLDIGITDRWSSISIKSLVAMEFCFNNFEFDYLVRGNASVFYNLAILREFLEKFTPEYTGPVEKNKPFVTGWSMIISRSMVSKVLTEFSWKDLRYFDDEAFGRILSRFARPLPMPFLVIKTIEDLAKKSAMEIKNFPAIRAKILDKNGRADDLAHRILSEKLKEV